MEVCKNKSSGRYFICIYESGNNEALFVTPNAEIKSLKLDLFSNSEEHTEEWLLSEILITPEQSRRFHEYEKNRSDEKVENLEYLFDQMSPFEKDIFIKKIQKKIAK